VVGLVGEVVLVVAVWLGAGVVLVVDKVGWQEVYLVVGGTNGG